MAMYLDCCADSHIAKSIGSMVDESHNALPQFHHRSSGRKDYRLFHAPTVFLPCSFRVFRASVVRSYRWASSTKPEVVVSDTAPFLTIPETPEYASTSLVPSGNSANTGIVLSPSP